MSYNFDPELAEMAAMIPPGDLSDVQLARDKIVELLAAFNTDLDTTGLSIEDRHIAGPEGAPELGLRIYARDDAATNKPAVLFIHGGGFAVGNLETEHAAAVMLVRDLDLVVISVDYRLAPEHPFPAPLNDCYRALEWIHESVDLLGIDKTRVAVYGQSAGGGLAAAVALMARDNSGPDICYQVLGMPELDDRLDTVSMKSFIDTPMWHRRNAELSWQYYLGDAYTPGASNVPAYAAPARLDDASGLPPAYITAMEFDPLRDEDVLYALKLMQSGVAVELHTFPGTFHGSSMLQHAAISRRQQQEMNTVLMHALKLNPGQEKN